MKWLTATVYCRHIELNWTTLSIINRKSNSTISHSYRDHGIVIFPIPTLILSNYRLLTAATSRSRLAKDVYLPLMGLPRRPVKFSEKRFPFQKKIAYIYFFCFFFENLHFFFFCFLFPKSYSVRPRIWTCAFIVTPSGPSTYIITVSLSSRLLFFVRNAQKSSFVAMPSPHAQQKMIANNISLVICFFFRRYCRRAFTQKT